MDAHEVYLLSAMGGEPRRLTRNQLSEGNLHWSADGRQLLFDVHGDIDAGYQQIQRRIYSMDVASGKVQRWAADSAGSLSNYDMASDGSLIASVTSRTQVQLSRLKISDGKLIPVTKWPGTFGDFSVARNSPRVAFVYSSLEHPSEVYIADSLEKISSARAITAFNKLFTERELPKGIPYQWKADDGTEVEGMLIYPPGKFGAKHLRMLTLIHGGPASADGDKFRADHYDWGILAASQGWLVFRPNYRGSSGYGDKFQRDISPQILSRPGKDIMEGIDALVRDGIADPDRLTIGGYSYGGYLTNWLITQTGRFKAAVSGAGAVEHAAVWGNDDLTFDDAWYLGGTPWEAQQNYNDQAALWQMHRVTTPTHIVAGASDVRVPTLEAYLLERALYTLKVPSTLLIFPGEGHSLSKNPWHGKIKVREELKWLEKYCPSDRSIQSTH
jgi:dipeptidyl aminopeptidase/acylaminoacyl peptidase